MDFYLVLACVILSIGCGLIFYNICGSIYTWYDHYGWMKDSKPDKKAKIQSITSKRVQYVKNGAKLKTTITFSDGFYFITYKTDRDNNFFTYRIYLSDELKNTIVELATEQHNYAVERFNTFKSNRKK